MYGLKKTHKQWHMLVKSIYGLKKNSQTMAWQFPYGFKVNESDEGIYHEFGIWIWIMNVSEQITCSFIFSQNIGVIIIWNRNFVTTFMWKATRKISVILNIKIIRLQKRIFFLSFSLDLKRDIISLIETHACTPYDLGVKLFNNIYDSVRHVKHVIIDSLMYVTKCLYRRIFVQVH